MKLEGASPELRVLEKMPGLADEGLRSAMKVISEEHQEQGATLRLEQQRLIAKYGPDSSQAKTAAVRLDLNEQMKMGIKVHSARLGLRTPEASNDQFIVYGRVLNTDGDGLGGLQVAAVNQKSQAAAQTTTDDQGVFSLSISVAANTIRGSAGAVNVKETKGARAEPELRLLISDRRKKTLYLDQQTFQPASGRLSYREVVLSQVTDATEPKISGKTKRS